MPHRQLPPHFIYVVIILAVFSLPAAQAATLTVTNLTDSGPSPLRQAITDANNTADHPLQRPSAWQKSVSAVVAQPGYSVELLNDELAGPVELDFDQTGNILVANEGISNAASDDFVSKLTRIGTMLAREFISGLEGASGLKIDINGNIYVSQDIGRPISKYDSTGAFILQFAPHRPQFSDPNTLALTQDERILAAVENVPSDNQWRVLAYDILTGQRLPDFTAPFEFEIVNTIVYWNSQVFIGGGVVPGSPTGGPILIAEEGQTPVAYAYNDRLASGYVNGLAISTDGTLFITDNTRLRKVSTDGLVELLATGFEFARGLAIKDGCVFVSDFRDGTSGALYRVCPNSYLDVDGNGKVTALEDGLLTIRYEFGFRGATLINGAVGTGCTRCTAAVIETYLAQCEAAKTTDIDGNNAITALEDGLLTIRYEFGFRGATLINGAVGTGCTRCTAEAIESYLGGLIP